MSSTKKRYYVVWVGHNPGVYDDYEDARAQVDGFPDARWKSYASPQEAAYAYRNALVGIEKDELARIITEASDRAPQSRGRSVPDGVEPDAWAVDAACAGNPGIMEYRGVDLATGKQLFHVGPFPVGTNNIGEFLAIVHAMALMEQRGEKHTIYSDSRTGMSWVKNRRIRTNLAQNERTRPLFDLMYRAMNWLNTHSFRAPLKKWETKIWGEIPADFGRKG